MNYRTANTNATVLITTREHFEREMRPAGWYLVPQRGNAIRIRKSQMFPHGFGSAVLDNFWDKPASPRRRK